MTTERIVSVSHLTALDGSPEEFVAAAASAGFNGVGLRIIPPSHTPGRWPVYNDEKRVRALRKQADDLGIRIFEAESFMASPDLNLDVMKRGFAACAELGVSVVVAAGAQPDEALRAESYASLAELAAPYGIIIGMEFMAFRPMATLQDALATWRRVNHPNARLLIDALHLDRSGGTPADVGKIDPAAIGYIHICDAPALRPEGMDFATEARVGRLYPGEGALPLNALFDALPADIPVSLEAPVGELAHLTVAERLKRAAGRTLGFFEERRLRG